MRNYRVNIITVLGCLLAGICIILARCETKSEESGLHIELTPVRAEMEVPMTAVPPAPLSGVGEDAETLSVPDTVTEMLSVPVSEEKAVATLTAYCPCVKCCGKTDGITASGERAREGVTIAADTSRYPIGTKIVIDGNTYTVQDRGGAIKGDRIDVFFSSHEAALKFGKQVKEITILKEIKNNVN